ncbi:MAG: recombination regulator RecX [Dehalococcoidia bacterium]|nr:recombination regulator RecX [Dehalococcoidia bacterium]
MTTKERQFQRALSVALRYISYRQRSSSEVKSKLLEQHPTAIVDLVLQRLEETNLLDDEQFAFQWVEFRNKIRPKSAIMLRRELAQKGVATDLIEKAVVDVDDSHNAYIAATKFRGKRDPRTVNNFTEKLFSHLKRRGYSYTVIKRTIDEVARENCSQSDI